MSTRCTGSSCFPLNSGPKKCCAVAPPRAPMIRGLSVHIGSLRSATHKTHETHKTQDIVNTKRFVFSEKLLGLHWHLLTKRFFFVISTHVSPPFGRVFRSSLPFSLLCSLFSVLFSRLSSVVCRLSSLVSRLSLSSPLSSLLLSSLLSLSSLISVVSSLLFLLASLLPSQFSFLPCFDCFTSNF